MSDLLFYVKCGKMEVYILGDDIMGFLDRFKKKPEPPASYSIPSSPTVKPSFDLIVSATKDGRCQMEFEDFKADELKQFYDRTRLIINGKPITIKGHTLYDCDIAWYGSTDAVLLGPEGEKHGRRNDFKNILAEIDISRMQTDSRYCQFVMRGLLNRKRVLRYLEKGLRDSPDLPCGKYVGGVRYLENGELDKFFSCEVGEVAHSSPEMTSKREAHKRNQEAIKARQIAENQARIQRLQDEIADLSR